MLGSMFYVVRMTYDRPCFVPYLA